MALELALSVGQGQGQGSGQGQSNAGQKGMGSLINIDGEEVKRFGSVTSVCAGLLSHPTSELRLATPILYFTRQNPQSAVATKARSILERAFKEVEVVQGKGDGKGEDMPRGKAEWEGIMRFWGKILAREEGWKGEGEVFEVVK
jgi:hypothetical protein